MCLAVQVRAQVGLFNITELDCPGYDDVTAYDINDAGQVVGYATVFGGSAAFSWQNNSLTFLPSKAGYPYTQAARINTGGVVAATWLTLTANRGFLWLNGAVTELQAPPSWPDFNPLAINDAGDVAGRAFDSLGNAYAILWHGGAPAELKPLAGANNAEAHGINSHGQVVGWCVLGGPHHAIQWKATGPADIDNVSEGGVYSEAHNINDIGQIVGLSVDKLTGLKNPCIWQQDGTRRSLGTVPGYKNGVAEDINNAGQVVGSLQNDQTQSYTAFLWQNNQFRDLNSLIGSDSGWILDKAYAINNRGQIVGHGYHYVNGKYVGRAFLLTPVGTLLRDHAGNIGQTTCQIVYPGLQAGLTTKAHLTDGQTTIDAGDPVVVVDDENYKTTVLRATFDLTGAKPSKWSLVIESPNVQPVTLQDAFLVEEARNPTINIQLTGRTHARRGWPTTYRVVVSNSGNFDAVDVPIWIGCSDLGAVIQPTFQLAVPPPLPGISVDWANRFKPYVLSEMAKLGVIVPRVPPGAVITLEFTVDFPNLDLGNPPNTQVSAWTNPLYRQLMPNPADGADASVLAALREIGRQVYLQATGVNLDNDGDPKDPGRLDAAAAVAKGQLDQVRANAYQNSGLVDSPTPLTYLIEQEAMVLAGYKGVTISDGALSDAVKSVFGHLDSLLNVTKSGVDKESPVGQGVNVDDADDPNGVSGPVTSVPDIPGNWVGGDQALGFTVHFENVGGFPVQKVTVVDNIDTVALDLSTLSLGAIAMPVVSPIVPTSGISPVGASSLDPTAGHFDADVSMPARNFSAKLNVHVHAELDSAGGKLIWEFTCKRADGLNITEDDGFLAKGEEGTITFTIQSLKIKDYIATQNWATVDFHLQNPDGSPKPPIATPVWYNLIDNFKPHTWVLRLPAILPINPVPKFTVSWHGDDTGVSKKVVRDFTIYVSKDHGPYLPWLTRTTKTSDVFTGEIGHGYRFYSLATDLTGNVAVAKPGDPTDTFTFIPFGPYQLSLTSSTVTGSLPITGTVTMNKVADADTPVTVTLTDINKIVKSTTPVVIKKGTASSTFSLPTIGVKTNTKFKVNATYTDPAHGDFTLSTDVTLQPVHPLSVSVSPNTVKGGGSVDGTVTLECPATSAGSVAVILKASPLGVVTFAPASMTIPSGAATGSFKVITKKVTTQTIVTITATGNGVSKTTTLTVTP